MHNPFKRNVMPLTARIGHLYSQIAVLYFERACIYFEEFEKLYREILIERSKEEK